MGKDYDSAIAWKTHYFSKKRSEAQGSIPWPVPREMIALFSVYKTITKVAEVCGKGRTSLRDFLILRPDLRERCLEAAGGTVNQRPVTVDLEKKRAERARRYVLRSQPENREYEAIIRMDPCAYCALPRPVEDENRMTLDHIQPRILGGEESWENYTGACLRCNGEKNGTKLLQFLLDRVNAC